MTEVRIVMCDGPTCTEQRDAKEPNDWIDVIDWKVPLPHTDRQFHFCSWPCVGQFAEAHP